MKKNETPDTYDSREYWVGVLTRIAQPVLGNLSVGRLKETMPVECRPGREPYARSVTHLEAFGRVLAGISPWLDLGGDATPEGASRQKFITLAQESLSNCVDASSPDRMDFSHASQPLVDAAFLAHGLIRGRARLWESLPEHTKGELIRALRSTRTIRPAYSNWLLFSATIEAFFLLTENDWDAMRLDVAVRKFFEWYEGDGLYGDGPELHWDYYNSFVIHPMLIDVLRILAASDRGYEPMLKLALERARRYAIILERLISPEGTFPPIGRSLAYRFGAFQLLAQMALARDLPDELVPEQVRSALSAVIHRSIEVPGTFDEAGWLTIGFCGHQPAIGEGYISTGSLYLCTAGLLPLGLPADDRFWSAPSAAWTQKLAWAAEDFPIDHALSSG